MVGTKKHLLVLVLVPSRAYAQCSGVAGGDFFALRGDEDEDNMPFTQPRLHIHGYYCGRICNHILGHFSFKLFWCGYWHLSIGLSTGDVCPYLLASLPACNGFLKNPCSILCKFMVTFQKTGPPSLIEFHSIVNETISSTFDSKLCV